MEWLEIGILVIVLLLFLVWSRLRSIDANIEHIKNMMDETVGANIREKRKFFKDMV